MEKLAPRHRGCTAAPPALPHLRVRALAVAAQQLLLDRQTYRLNQLLLRFTITFQSCGLCGRFPARFRPGLLADARPQKRPLLWSKAEHSCGAGAASGQLPRTWCRKPTSFLVGCTLTSTWLPGSRTSCRTWYRERYHGTHHRSFSL
jgi:hypothetical protein